MPVHFKPGICPNPKGRPKGSKDKFRYDVADILHKMGCNPFQILGEIAMDETKSIHARTTAASELCGYVAPKLKHIELASDAESPFTITLNLNGAKK